MPPASSPGDAGTIRALAGVVQWQNTSFPSSIRGFDSLHPLQADQSWFSDPWKVTGTGTDDFQFLIDITGANDPGNVIDVPAS